MAEASGFDLDTPFLEVDRQILERNIARVADFAKENSIALRPHAKTHKCVEIGRMQLAAGAVGLTLATVGEAEVFADAGFEDIFLAYPIWPSIQRLSRLQALNDRIKLRIGIDSAESAKLLGKAIPKLAVLVEIDSGHHRSGVVPGDAGKLASAASEAGLDVVGLFTFPGHSYSPGSSRTAAKSEAQALLTAVESFKSNGIEPKVISGGSTPSWRNTDSHVVNEMRPGVYVFGDAQQLELGNCSEQEIALTVASTVVSTHGQSVIVDAGSKALGADRAGWASGFGRILGCKPARITALSEHHATVEFPVGEVVPKLGSRLQVIPNHVCNTVNLVSEMYLTNSGQIEEVWPVLARGKNS